LVPLIVLIVAWLGLRAAGGAGVFDAAATWTGALRYALAAMFLFTALSHFLPRTRADLVRMVPPRLPAPGLLVTITGIFELAGAAGLLIALFPANVHAARGRLTIAGRPATPLAIRLPLQLVWIGALWYVARNAP
jgi:uncharacterized membrane protein